MNKTNQGENCGSAFIFKILIKMYKGKSVIYLTGSKHKGMEDERNAF